jgi:hypothetical protein
MSYNVKNYTEQGGAKTVIGGTLEIKSGATVTGLPQGVAVADAAGSAPTAAEFKALLDSLRNAGIIATS